MHELLVALLSSAQHSIVVNMFGYDDDELNKIIQAKLANEHVYVQMSLDRSQAAGVHEKQILANWDNNAFGNSIAIGTSSVHNAISHLKIVIVDGVYTVKGSTNWSLSGEQQQDNELTLSRNAVIAAETRAILDLNHDFMLKQMAGSKLDIAKLAAPANPAEMPPLPPIPPSVTRAARNLTATAAAARPAPRGRRRLIHRRARRRIHAGVLRRGRHGCQRHSARSGTAGYRAPRSRAAESMSCPQRIAW